MYQATFIHGSGKIMTADFDYADDFEHFILRTLAMHMPITKIDVSGDPEAERKFRDLAGIN